MNSSRTLSLAAVLAAAALAVPAGALAKGGSSGPAPTPNPAQCDYLVDGLTDDGLGAIFSNQVGDAGCVTVVSRSGGISLYRVLVSDGWTYKVDSSGGSSGVRVTFTQTVTGWQSSARISPGKTEIR